MDDKAYLLELAAKCEARRPFLCWLGFHKVVQIEWLITCGRSVCVNCGTVINESLFGDFTVDRSESAACLKALASMGENP